MQGGDIAWAQVSGKFILFFLPFGKLTPLGYLIIFQSLLMITILNHLNWSIP